MSVHQFSAKAGLPPRKSFSATSSVRERAAGGRGIWWLSPCGLILGLLIPIFLVILLLGEINSPGMTVRGIRFLNWKYSLLGIAIMLLMALTAYIGQQIDLKGHGEIKDRNWSLPAWILGLVTLFAYLYWFRQILFSPATLFGVLTGSIFMGRDQIAATAGVSSLANFMPAFFSLISYLLATKPERVSVRLRILAATLVVLTIFRVFVWAERLALIELAVAVSVPVLCAFISKNPGRWRRVALILPLIALPLLILYFGVAEYFRSWQSDFYRGKMPFWEFVLGRFGSYYYTSLNNGVGLLETQAWPTYQYENVLMFLHKAPWLVGAIFRYYMELDGPALSLFLNRYADLEFNNPSGIYSVIFDVGVPWALIYFSLIGFFSGVMYRSLLAGQARGVLLYPMCFVMLLEVYRYPYFGTSRAFTTTIGVALALFLLRKAKAST